MKYEDIPQVVRIDRATFPGEWVFRSESAYKHDLDNTSIRYIVACERPGMSEARRRDIGKPSWCRQLFSWRRSPKPSEAIVGFSGFWMMMREAHIIAIGVRDDYRRLGIGEGLLIATIELAEILNAILVTLEVRASNNIAQELYRKYGFRAVGRRLKYYSRDREDAIIMSTDNITSIPFQSSFQQLKNAHAQKHPGISTQIR